MAQIIDALHYSPQEVAAMTHAQIDRLCFHPRNKDGSIRLPSPPAVKRGGMPHVPDAGTLEEALARLEAYYREMRMDEASLAAAREKLRATWGK
jgi:hypothetical protein